MYYIQVREQHQKTEKMRDIHGISNMLSTCFSILTICGLLLHLINAFIYELSFVENTLMFRGFIFDISCEKDAFEE